MAEHRFEIGVIVARRRLASRWADHAWAPHAILPVVPSTQAGAFLGRAGQADLLYGGACELALHSSATSHYRDNLSSGSPALWIALRPSDEGCAVAAVTADPYEAEALTEGLGSIVEPVAMPPAVQEALAAFIAAFHVERPFLKRERDRADVDSLGFRPRGDEP
jgi:hypothetical protein